jgi:transposase
MNGLAAHLSSIYKDKYGVSRKTYYKWRNRYDKGSVEEGPHDLSRGPHTIKYEVSQKIEETILDLRLEEIWL